MTERTARHTPGPWREKENPDCGEVSAFWRAQPFDLRLPAIDGATPHGNCDLCFMKGAAILTGLIRETPEAADWWIGQERKIGATFRNGRPDYAALRENAFAQRTFDFEPEDAAMPCACHD